MKSRKSSLHDQLSVTKTKSQSSVPNKTNSNSYIKKKYPGLEQYACLFGNKGPSHIGDADTHFRKTLRKYNEFDLYKNTGWIRSRGGQVRPSGSHQKFLPIEQEQAAGDKQRKKRKGSNLELVYLYSKSEVGEFSQYLDSMADEAADTPTAGENPVDDGNAAEASEADATLVPDATLAADATILVPDATLPAEPIVVPDATLPAEPIVVPDATLPADPIVVPDATLPPEPIVVPDATLPAEPIVVPDATLPAEPIVVPDETLPAEPIVVSDETLPAAPVTTATITLDETAPGEPVVTLDETTPETPKSGDEQTIEEQHVNSEAESEAKSDLDKTLVEVPTAVDELESAAADKPRTMSIQKHPSQAMAQGDKGMVPLVDERVLKELEDAEIEARNTTAIITGLKEHVAALLTKDHMTETEAKELEDMNRELTAHMETFEMKTRVIQKLVTYADELLIQMPQPGALPAPQERHKEDELPRLIVCGMTENNMPKIIICDGERKKKSEAKARTKKNRESIVSSPSVPKQPDVMPAFAKRLSESYDMQEKLAADNVDLEGKRIQLQEELLKKDRAVEHLQQRVGSLQAEMRILVKENSALKDKGQVAQGKCRPRPDMPCGGKGLCPADVENRLQQYTQTNSALRKQIETLECEMKKMHDELVHVQRAHQDMEQQYKVAMQKPQPVAAQQHVCRPTCHGPCRPGAAVEQQLRELREQYNRLQDDYKSKVTEVAGLRADNENLKCNCQNMENCKRLAENKLEDMEKDLRKYDEDKSKWKGNKEQIIEQEQQLTVAKQRFRDAQDELEELRALIGDQASQLEDYRNKYLQAQQQVEEQRRQIDMMEMENNRVSEQVAVEIQRIKNQFQEKIIELSPLPDILKATQMKLQEEQQMRLLAERNGEALARELQLCKDKAQEVINQMEKVRSDQVLNEDERANMQSKITGWQCKCNEVQQSCDKLKTTLARTEEQAAQNEKRLDEKLHEVAQLTGQLESVREESARQVARTKDRCETVRRSLQSQVADMERQLAQARAMTRTAQKDRDEIRQKMQAQMNNLVENFEEAQMRIRSLQGHVNFLQTSYTNIYRDGGASAAAAGAVGCSGTETAMIADENCDCGSGKNFQ